MLTPDELLTAAKKADGHIDLIKAEERTQLTEFLHHITKNKPNSVWEFGEAYDTADGWLVVWQVGDVALVHPAKWCRAFIRDLRDSNSPQKRPDFPNRKGFEDMLGDWDVWAKRVIENNRRGVKPGDTPAPLLRSVPGGLLAADLRAKSPEVRAQGIIESGPNAPIERDASDEADAQARPAELCDACRGGAVMHTAHGPGDRTEKLCCACYVAQGNPPADWHTGCMKAAGKIESLVPPPLPADPPAG